MIKGYDLKSKIVLVMKYNLQRNIDKLAPSILATVLLILINLVWLGGSLIWTPEAKADAFNNQQPQLLVNSDIAENLEQKVKKTIDQTMGSGTSDQIEGKLDEAAANVQQKTGEVIVQVEGAMKRAKSKVEQNIGEIKSAAEKASSKIEKASQGFLEQVKGFFRK